MLGLGGSIATPANGITAEIVPVHTFDELEKKGRAAVEGKIVLYNEDNLGYGRTVVYRSTGASRAAKLGAVAVLVRSVWAEGKGTRGRGYRAALLYADPPPPRPSRISSRPHRDGARVLG